MDQKLLVDAITTETSDWTCKEQQVSIVLYGDGIPKYEKLFALFETYLVSCTKFRDPRGYSIRAGTYEWVVDRYIIVEMINTNDGLEAVFPTPTKLNALSFSAIEYQRPGVEFDLLAIVANSSAIQYTADQSKYFQEVIVMDQSHKPFLFTIWGNLADNKGVTLLHHLHKHPIILAKRIGVTGFRGALRLATRYQSIILTNPQYVQATTLMNWCHFQVDITDVSDIITVTISETLAEKMLSLTAEQIYETVVVQQQLLSITRINEHLAHKLFKLHLQKPVFRFPDQKSGMLAIIAFTEVVPTYLGDTGTSTSRYTCVSSPSVPLGTPFEEEIGVDAHDMDYVEVQENYGIEEENEVDAVNLDEDDENIGETPAVGNANVRSELINLPLHPPRSPRARKTTSIA
ncbi:hypothetical protein FXO38_24307 [Capsicum annuum]|nr:hypothetical protein FXO38_24307 [Capsicum annuum]